MHIAIFSYLLLFEPGPIGGRVLLALSSRISHFFSLLRVVLCALSSVLVLFGIVVGKASLTLLPQNSLCGDIRRSVPYILLHETYGHHLPTMC